MTYTHKMPNKVETSDVTKNALAAAMNEKERLAVRAAEAGMTVGLKKPLDIKVNGRTANKKAVR
jgi:hypothetical protein